jgi:hypothetical protein
MYVSPASLIRVDNTDAAYLTALDRTRAISAFSFDEFAIVKATPHQSLSCSSRQLRRSLNSSPNSQGQPNETSLDPAASFSGARRPKTQPRRAHRKHPCAATSGRRSTGTIPRLTRRSHAGYYDGGVLGTRNRGSPPCSTSAGTRSGNDQHDH